jgi:hypothetical protein
MASSSPCSIWCSRLPYTGEPRCCPIRPDRPDHTTAVARQNLGLVVSWAVPPAISQPASIPDCWTGSSQAQPREGVVARIGSGVAGHLRPRSPRSTHATRGRQAPPCLLWSRPAVRPPVSGPPYGPDPGGAPRRAHAGGSFRARSRRWLTYGLMKAGCRGACGWCRAPAADRGRYRQ